MLVRVSKSHERIRGVSLRFMNAADCPLARPLQTAAPALTTRDFDGSVVVAVGLTESDFPVRCSIASERSIAGHQVALDPPAAAHGATCGVAFGDPGSAPERPARLLPGHLVAHGDFPFSFEVLSDFGHSVQLTTRSHCTLPPGRMLPLGGFRLGRGRGHWRLRRSGRVRGR